VRSTPLACSSVVIALLLAAPGEAAGGVALTKARARSEAVEAARGTCAVTPWCRRWAVEPARSCARRSSRRVDCTIRFRPAEGRWSSGLVIVTRTRRGRLDVGVAVPIQPVLGELQRVPG
jgi:hypothetical protein